MDLRTTVKVRNKGKPLVEKNLQAFEGAENPIDMTRFYKTSYTCNFDMAWYPFDTQRCSMVFVLEEVSEKKVDLKIGNLEYSGPLDLTQYFIRKRKMYSRKVSGRKMVFVDVFLGRRLLSIIMTVFIPSIILNFVGHASNFFKEFFFEAIISVNVTTMLVITTMFINVSNNLPKTAYIKMIDIWLLFNLTKPFVDILVTTYIDSLKTDESREINHHGETRRVGEDDDGTPHRTILVTPAKIHPSDLVDTNEAVQQKALKIHYENLKRQKASTRENKIRWWKRFSLVTNPIICVAFVIGFWAMGLNEYYRDLD